VIYAAVGPRAAYTISGALGRLFYWLLPAPRMLAEAPCAQRWRGEVRVLDSRDRRGELAAARVEPDDLLLAERLLHPGTYSDTAANP